MNPAAMERLGFKPRPDGPPPMGQCDKKCGRPAPMCWLLKKGRWADGPCEVCHAAAGDIGAKPPTLREQLRRAGFGEAVIDVVLSEDVTPLPKQIEVMDWAAPPGGAMVIRGDVGPGKTVSTAFLARKRIEARSHKVLYANWPRLTEALQEGIRDPDTPEAREARETKRRLRTVDLAIIDDLGVGVRDDGHDVARVREISSWQKSMLYTLIDARSAHNRPFVIVTNLLPADLARVLGGRVESRLIGMLGRGGRIVEFEGPDLRMAGALAY